MLKCIIILAAVAVYSGEARIYHLYTRGNSRPQNITIGDNGLPSTFSAENRTIILIHGHGGSVTTPSNALIIREIFNVRKDYNIIVVDWEREASNGYNAAMAGVRPVANDLAAFIRWLAEQTSIQGKDANTSGDIDVFNSIFEAGSGDGDPGVDPVPIVNVQELHLVGFGLGAHIAGIASRQVILPLGRVGRITGLDPSGSGWGSRSDRLKADDAKYVEVLHTDGTGLLANGIGTPIGDVDIFANGGSNQPGCFSHSCSHDRAWELFAASMGGHLIANRCSSKTQLNLNLCRGTPLWIGGTELEKNTPYDSIYRVNTKRNFPF